PPGPRTAVQPVVPRRGRGGGGSSARRAGRRDGPGRAGLVLGAVVVALLVVLALLLGRPGAAADGQGIGQGTGGAAPPGAVAVDGMIGQDVRTGASTPAGHSYRAEDV
ncbi:hypothetical protein, partial [Cellulomonas endophytica]|uniref:hypothetical protein n=1 Tax=Cellulomonas endophytica TaxID=2494735 RepID=UPI00196B56C2